MRLVCAHQPCCGYATARVNEMRRPWKMTRSAKPSLRNFDTYIYGFSHVVSSDDLQLYTASIKRRPPGARSSAHGPVMHFSIHAQPSTLIRFNIATPKELKIRIIVPMRVCPRKSGIRIKRFATSTSPHGAKTVNLNTNHRKRASSRRASLASHKKRSSRATSLLRRVVAVWSFKYFLSVCCNGVALTCSALSSMYFLARSIMAKRRTEVRYR